jgi:uncharacterized protein YndB with AHSA1/START domain
MNIDPKAPVRARAERTVAAPPEVVWDLLADPDSWSAWNPEVASARLRGPLEPGSEIRWKAGGVSIASTLASVDRPAELEWTGRAPGLRAIHVWRLDARDGVTHLVTEESMGGLAARVLGGRLQTILERSLESWLHAIETEAQRRDRPA